MDEPAVRDHVRRPDLPWRVSTLTECGRPAADVKIVITRTELMARLVRDGVRRASYATCMQCMETARRWPEWDENPVKALSREFYGAADPRLGDELRALAALAVEHREDFDSLMVGLRQAPRLADARRARRRRSG